MNGIMLRLLGSGIVVLVLVGLLSGWAAIFSTGAFLVTTVQFGALILGLVMVYRGSNLPTRTQASRHRRLGL